jgi:hypothetical protein
MLSTSQSFKTFFLAVFARDSTPCLVRKNACVAVLRVQVSAFDRVPAFDQS